MTWLDRWITGICAYWRETHPDKVLERAIPAYGRAAERERRAIRAGSTREIGRARKAKFNALHRDMAGGLDWRR
ncbi:MAG: hypothetical protein PS018_26480 [bacterium]|nr:hypothetical protein [bacterium]